MCGPCGLKTIRSEEIFDCYLFKTIKWPMVPQRQSLKSVGLKLKNKCFFKIKVLLFL